MTPTEDELLERWLTLWHAYKVHLIGGILMILSAVAGIAYQTVSSEEKRRAAGSALFELAAAAQNEDWQTAQTALTKINGDRFPELHNLGRIALATANHNAGKTEDAITDMRAALANETDDSLRPILVLRLAELLINNNNTEEALTLLDKNTPAEQTLQMLFIELRGDAYYAADQLPQALAEYNQARTIAAAIFRPYVAMLDIKIGAVASLPAINNNADADAAATSSTDGDS